jgi:hypothetical protein
MKGGGKYDFWCASDECVWIYLALFRTLYAPVYLSLSYEEGEIKIWIFSGKVYNSDMENIKTREEFSTLLRTHLEESWEKIVEQKRALKAQEKEMMH